MTSAWNGAELRGWRPQSFPRSKPDHWREPDKNHAESISPKTTWLRQFWTSSDNDSTNGISSLRDLRKRCTVLRAAKCFGRIGSYNYMIYVINRSFVKCRFDRQLLLFIVRDRSIYNKSNCVVVGLTKNKLKFSLSRRFVVKSGLIVPKISQSTDTTMSVSV